MSVPMREILKTRINRLHDDNTAHDREHSDRLLRYRSLEPESAELLATLILCRQAQTVLEIGTSNGYSSLWIAAALQHTGGHLTTWEFDSNRSRRAAQHAREAGVEDRITFVEGDAGELLTETEGSFDVIFLDAERPAYCSYWPHLKRLLARPGSLLVTDNILSHADQVADFRRMTAADPNFAETAVPVGAGLLLTVRL